MLTRWILCLLCVLEFSRAQIVNIGIVNRMWKDILETRLTERSWTDRCRLFEIDLPSNISFYDSIKQAFDMMTTTKFDVIIGDSRLDVAQAASTISLPFISFDSRLHRSQKPEYANMVNLYALPVPMEKYALAIFDILKYYKINNVAIIVDETVDYQNFVQMFFEKKTIYSKVWTITAQQQTGQTNLENEISQILKEIRANDYLDIIVKTNRANLNVIISRAQFYGMISIPTRWYIPNFVCEKFNMEKIKHIFTNIIFINEECSEQFVTTESKSKQMSLVNQFLQIIRLVNWDFSVNTLNKLLKNNPKTLYSFDDQGKRNQFTLLFHTMSRQVDKLLTMIGSWQKTIGHQRVFHMKANNPSVNFFDGGFPSFLKIVAVEEHPHLIVKNNYTYVGFGVDLTKKIADMLLCNFSIKLVTSYGTKTNGVWDGLVGELIYDRSDMSLGPVVQTREREEILDFSTTFKQREISLVMKKPSSSVSYFQFLGPFSGFIWLCLAISMFLLIVTLIILEWFHDKYFPEKDRIKFNFKESSWFIVASYLQGGTEDVPFSVPGRILTGTLYFFVLIIVTSYTANLAAFLTVKAFSNPIKSIDDLVNLPPDSKITFGTVKESAIYDFFKHSEIPAYRKIYELMDIRNVGWLVNTTSEGYKRAMEEDYVFIWDDSINQYEIFTESQYNCTLYIVGRPFGKRSFAISMPQGSQIKEKVNTALLHLMESGFIENLEHKWWKSASICSGDNPSSEMSSGSLSIDEVAGVFIVLMSGTAIAIISLVVKILIYKCKRTHAARKSARTATKAAPLYLQPSADRSPIHLRTLNPSIVHNEL